MVAARFPDRTFPLEHMQVKSIRQALAKKLKLATFDVESLSWSLVLQPEPSRRRLHATLN